MKAAALFQLLLLLLSCSTGCVPVSQIPLTEPGQQPLDERLLGSWYWQQGAETGLVHIGLQQQGQLLQVLMVDYGQRQQLSIQEFSGLSSKLASGDYLSLRPLRPANEQQGYLIIKYHIQNKSLQISLMDSKPVEEALRDKQLEGIAGDRGFASEQISSPAPELQNFIALHDQDLFHDFSTLQRLELKEAARPTAQLTLKKTFEHGSLVEYQINQLGKADQASLRVSQRFSDDKRQRLLHSHLRFASAGPAMTAGQQGQLLSAMLAFVKAELGPQLKIDSLSASGYLGVAEVEEQAVHAFINHQPWLDYLANPRTTPQWQIYQSITKQLTETGVYDHIITACQHQGYQAQLSGFEKLFINKVADSAAVSSLSQQGIPLASRYPSPGTISFRLTTSQLTKAAH